PELFNVIGYLYGGSGGVFNLPDYRGRFFRGTASTTEQDPGLEDRKPPQGGNKSTVGSTQDYMVQLHEHQYNFFEGAAVAQEGSQAYLPAASAEDTTLLFDRDGRDITKEATETRPKNIYVYFIIKFTSGPVRIGEGVQGPFFK